MARSSKHAVLLCTIMSITTAAAIIAAFYFKKPIILPIALLPVAAYEIYRTEGVSTIWASWGMLVALVALLVLQIAQINIDLLKIVKASGLPFSSLDIKILIPVVMAFFAFILIKRTMGIYTKWLSVIIFIASVALFFMLDPELFKKILSIGSQEGLKKLQR